MTKKSIRRQRAHDVLPAGFKWREGRPRWEPSPTRRKQGWRGVDLKDAWGRWQTKGVAVERAQAIVEAIDAWTKGQPVPGAMTAFAPQGAEVAGAANGAANPRSIGALLDAYRGDKARKIAPSQKFAGLGAATQADYRRKLDRFLQIVAKVEGVDKVKDQVKIDKLKALDIDVLLPPPDDDPSAPVIERAYDELREVAGESMAAGVLACVSAWLGWCVKKRRIWPTNPAELVERKTPEGRIVVYEWPEIVALVRQADAMGLASIADAIILAIDLSWSQQDILAITERQISADGHIKHRRIKTGVAGNPPLLALGKARLDEIRCRWQGQTVKPLRLIVCEMTNKPWVADTFRHKFAEVRAKVAEEFPEVATKQFRDLRDTAITYYSEGGLNIDEICSRSLHSPTRAQAVISKHYGAIRQGVTDGAADKLDEHFKKSGYTFKKEGEG